MGSQLVIYWIEGFYNFWFLFNYDF